MFSTEHLAISLGIWISCLSNVYANTSANTSMSRTQRIFISFVPLVFVVTHMATILNQQGILLYLTGVYPGATAFVGVATVVIAFFSIKKLTSLATDSSSLIVSDRPFAQTTWWNKDGVQSQIRDWIPTRTLTNRERAIESLAIMTPDESILKQLHRVQLGNLPLSYWLILTAVLTTYLLGLSTAYFQANVLWIPMFLQLLTIYSIVVTAFVVLFQKISAWRERLSFASVEFSFPNSRIRWQRNLMLAFILDLMPIAFFFTVSAAYMFALGRTATIDLTQCIGWSLVLFVPAAFAVTGIAAIAILVHRLWLGRLCAALSVGVLHASAVLLFELSRNEVGFEVITLVIITLIFASITWYAWRLWKNFEFGLRG